MTKSTYNRLREVRGIMSAIGWLLMIINLFIGLVAIIFSIIRNTSIISFQPTMLVIFSLSMLIGLLAFVDMIIYRRIRACKEITD